MNEVLNWYRLYNYALNIISFNKQRYNNSFLLWSYDSYHNIPSILLYKLESNRKNKICIEWIF